MNRRGITFLEIIIGVTIFSIFMVATTAVFSTYTEISRKNNILVLERLQTVSKLEKFISNGDYVGDGEVVLKKKSGFEELPFEIICIEKQEISLKTQEILRAFIYKK